MNNYLIIGQGKIGLPVTNSLADSLTKLGCKTTGMARRDRSNYDLHQSADFIQVDATQLSAEFVRERISQCTHIAIIVTPSERGEDGYRNSYLAIAEHIASLQGELPNLQRIIFISSTGIYGQGDIDEGTGGEWIDENTIPQTPKHIMSQLIYQAEQVLQTAFTDKCTIIRPSGIYGNDRLMRVNKAKENDKMPMAEYAWTNRIMDSDLVNIIVNVLTENNPKPLYLATDYLPVTSYELTTWLCHNFGSELPVIDNALPPSGKRIHSNIPLAWLEFADWQGGYQHVLDNI